MSVNLLEEIKTCRHSMDIIDAQMVTEKFIFKKEFSGFKGHFENNPVLPGVCKIQTAIEVIKKWKQRDDLELKEIVLAKFFLPVLCNEELTFNCFDTEKEGGFTFNITILKGEEMVSKLKLKLKFKD